MVFGYIRESQLTILNVNIPIEIYHICFAFFYDIMKFDPNKCENGLKITNNGKGLTKSGNDGNWSSCLFGTEITKQDCDKFNVFMKFLEGTCFQMGYIFTKEHKFNQSSLVFLQYLVHSSKQLTNKFGINMTIL